MESRFKKFVVGSTKNVVALSIVSLLLTPTVSLAQTQQASIAVPYSPQYADRMANQYVIRAGNGEGERPIPEYVYYGIIFGKLASAPDTAGQVTSSDWQLIQNLPSHSDQRFQSVNYAELDEICLGIQVNAANLTDEKIVDFAIAQDSSRKRYEATLAKHYQDVLSRLSASTRQLVESERKGLVDSDSVGHGRFDIVSYAQDYPTEALDRLLGGCEALTIMREKNPPRSIRLNDEGMSSVAAPLVLRR